MWRRGVWDSVSAVRSDVTIRLPLSRRECRCRAAQWLGEQLGLDPGTTVPRWEYSRPDGAWILSTEHDAVMFNRTGFYGGLPCRKLPEIADQDGPVEKTLRTACLSISASEDVR